MHLPSPHVGTAAATAVLALVAIAAAPAAAAPAKPAFALTVSDTGSGKLVRGTPGRVVRGAVVVRSLSSRAVTVKLQAADIGAASNGNAAYKTSRLKGAGRWLRLATHTVRLQPNAVQTVTYTLSIPSTARRASYYAGIVGVNAAELAAARRKPSQKKAFNFSNVNRQALPITVRLPGRLYRRLTLRSVTIKVEPAGAGLVLALRPGGTQLITSASVNLTVSRGAKTVITHASTLGQLFPGEGLNFRIPWTGRPTEGDYRVKGVIRPKLAKPIFIDQTVTFTPKKAAEAEAETTPIASTGGTPGWVWVALALGAALVLALLVTMLVLVLKLRHQRPVGVA
ncbi:hypothetical protein OJ997_05080 [Solirubrobacter phytolaccae]|uniref:DUF916 domain-containing protein n=1 Tax=Solirubrobacter phytolaccae TaxID=1404360 RepID=A0A9X3S672_9ACTN|nr:hypothetical protein [Solirubrobacter phytolaccae]MDA0179659.1 hypothetical protein [Solirubrobacter phytolaccae]